MFLLLWRGESIVCDVMLIALGDSRDLCVCLDSIAISFSD